MDTGVDNTRELRKEIDIETDTREILARASRYAEERNFKDWLIKTSKTPAPIATSP